MVNARILIPWIMQGDFCISFSVFYVVEFIKLVFFLEFAVAIDQTRHEICDFYIFRYSE